MRKTLSALAAGLLLAATGAHANLVTNGTFENPNIATDSSATLVSLGGWATTNWGHYSGHGVMVADQAGNQFATITPGDLIYTAFTVGTTGMYNVSFDYFNDGVWGLADPAWNNAVVASTQLDASPTWTAGGAMVSLTAGESYKLWFAGEMSPPAFNPYLAVDNVSVSAVPEPESFAMMIAGLGALGLMSRRRLNSRG
ncbi:MAG: hypothetical protein RL456_2107 [Pseudomonadota bacterium]|jgi:hypothetical protein